jgi:uncharacterized repeat protein (TIGR01451 family)
MARFHHVVSGIILLTLFFSVGIVCAAEGDTANLSVSKAVSSAAPYKTGQPVTWIVTLSNTGPANATNISLSESISGFSGQVDMSGVADQGTYHNTTRIWNISRLDNATSTHLTIITVFDTEGTQTNNVDILHLDQTSHENRHAAAKVVINNAGTVIPDQPLSVNLAIRPNTLNLKSKGVFTVFVTLNGGNSLFPFDAHSKPRADFASSSLTCSGAEMISAGVSNKDGGTLIAKFHRQDLENVTSGAGVQINCSGTLSVNGKSVDVEGSDTIRVIGEKKGLDKIISGLMRYLGLEKDDIAVNETEDGNITLSFTLDPDSFKDHGQVKKALKTTDSDTPAHAGNGQNASDKINGQKQNTVKNNGRDKNVQENNAGNNADKGNKNTNKGDDASNGKSNGKKNT